MADKNEGLKVALLMEKQATFSKYQALGLRQYAGLTDGNPSDTNQEKLSAAYRAEVEAIEARYKIMAGQA